MIHSVTTTVNGKRHTREVEARMLLSDFIRHELGLTGTHVGCEHGVCGACTILVDGMPMRSCLMLAVQANGRELATVEGLAPGRERTASAAGGVPHDARAAVRLLHAWDPDDDGSVPRGAPVSDGSRSARSALRQPVPLHRLPEHRGRGAARAAHAQAPR